MSRIPFPVRLGRSAALVVAIGVAIGVAFGAAGGARAGRALADEAAPGGVSVLCEVWRVDHPDLTPRLEALGERNPVDAEGARTLLREAREGAQRIARFLTPTQIGKAMAHEDVRQEAQTTAGGAGFAGFVESGTKLAFVVQEGPAGRLATEIEISVSVAGAQKVGPGPIPPDKIVGRVGGTVEGPSGATRMFQSSVADAETLVIFVTATRL